MREPIQIEDNGNAGYVHYSRAEIASTIDVRPDCAVAADVDADGDIVGIEFLSFDVEILECARVYAESHDLLFPMDIRKAVR